MAITDVFGQSVLDTHMQAQVRALEAQAELHGQMLTADSASQHASYLGMDMAAGRDRSVVATSTLRHDDLRSAAAALRGQYPPQRPLRRFSTVIQSRTDDTSIDHMEYIREQAARQIAKELLPYLHYERSVNPSAHDPYGRHTQHRFSLDAPVDSRPVDNYLNEIDKLVDEVTKLKQQLKELSDDTPLPRL